MALTIIRVKPVVVPAKGTGTIIYITTLPFVLFETKISFYWALRSEETNDDILYGNLTMEYPDLEGWGNDDEYVLNWILNKLGFERE